MFNRFCAGFGSLYINSDDGVDYVLTTAGTYYAITSMTTDGYLNTTLSAANGSITVAQTGYYKVGYVVSYSMSGAASATLKGALFNNTSISTIRSMALRSQNSIVTGATTGILKLNKGDVIDMRVTTDTDSITMKIYSLNLYVNKIS